MKNYLAIFCIISALFGVACSSVDKQATQDAEGVYMLALLPFSDNAELAAEMYNSMKLATVEVNITRDRMRGKELFLQVRSDVKGVYETGRVLDSILDSGVDILHIATGDSVIFKADALNESDKFINYMNDYAPATLMAKNAVRIFLSATTICEQMAKIIDADLLENQAQINVFALGADNLMTRSAVAYLKFEVVATQVKFKDEYFRKGEDNFDLLAQEIVHLKTDYVFVIGSGEENKDILKALDKYKFSGKLVFSARPTVACEGDYLVVEPDFGQSKEPSTVEFKEKYERAYGNAPKYYQSAYAYDSIILAAKSYNADPKNMRGYFLGQSFVGAIGKLDFDNTGDSNIKLKTKHKLLE